MQIESYRTDLESFEQNLNRELYRYYSGLKEPPESWAAALDGFESADYLRGWMLKCQLQEYIRTKYGKMPNRAASAFLKEIWETGQFYSAEELCQELGAGKLEPEILADELSGGLQF